ncbi:type IV pilus assembly protein PilM [Candidatus Saccharibacteria bacterium]|nr:MAG: type IV pilus assembly protein PilM [Candidatus Saccharibacteria bacterium]
MGSIEKTQLIPYLFEDKPLFGMDIGHNNVRIMQLQTGKHKPRVVGYGEISFDTSIIEDGVIVDVEGLARSIQKLFQHSLIGDITTRRVALSVPISKAFTRSLDMPKLSDKEILSAVQTEVEQYIPAAAESLYIDYSTVQSAKDKYTTFIVAMPRRIIDSYLVLTRLLGLEPVILQTTSGAGANMFSYDSQGDLPSVLVDFGNDSADITVYDKNPIVSGTVACGGQDITQLIAKSLGVTEREATIIKTKYGLSFSKKQKQIEAALSANLTTLVKEIQRSVRYYEERSKSKRQIAQVVIMGGGANMPGLADYLTQTLRLPVRAFDPTNFIDFGKLQPFNITERMSYVSAAGLSMLTPEEAF